MRTLVIAFSALICILIAASTASAGITVNVTSKTIPGQELLGDVISSSNISSVNATTEAKGSLAITTHIIEYYKTENGFISYGFQDCSPSGSYSYCNLTFTNFNSKTNIKYRARAIDSSQDSNTTSWRYIFSHPLANFVANNISMGIGTTYRTIVQVRNMLNITDNITVVIEDYDRAYFMDGIVFGNITYKIYNGGHSLDVYDMPPHEETVFYVDVLSKDVHVRNLMGLSSNSSNSQPKIYDNDIAEVINDFPPSFPGLNDLSVMVLILIAGLVFLRQMS